jgi:hypothetical protein
MEKEQERLKKMLKLGILLNSTHEGIKAIPIKHRKNAISILWLSNKKNIGYKGAGQNGWAIADIEEWSQLYKTLATQPSTHKIVNSFKYGWQDSVLLNSKEDLLAFTNLLQGPKLKIPTSVLTSVII